MISSVVNRLRLARHARVAMLMDQGFVSVGNFALTLALIHSYPARIFGAFGMASFTLLMLSSLYRMAYVIPFSLWHIPVFQRRLRALRTQHFTVLLSVFAILVTLDILAAFFVKGDFLSNTLAAMTGVACTYLSMDFDRIVVLRSRGAWASAFVSGSTTAAMFCLAIVVFFGRIDFHIAMYALAAIGLGKAALVNLRRHSFAPRHAKLLYGRLLRTSFGWGATGNLLSAVYNTIPQWVLGIAASPTQIAGFAAVRTPLQPLMLVIRGLDMADKSAFAAIDPKDRPARARRLKRSLMLYFSVSVAFALVVAVFAEPIVGFVLGARYLPFVSTFILTSFYYVLTAIVAPMETLVFAHGRQRDLAYAQGIGAVACLIVVYPFVVAFAANGAVLAAYFGWLPALYVLFRDFLREMREVRALPAG